MAEPRNPPLMNGDVIHVTRFGWKDADGWLLITKYDGWGIPLHGWSVTYSGFMSQIGFWVNRSRDQDIYTIVPPELWPPAVCTALAKRALLGAA